RSACRRAGQKGKGLPHPLSATVAPFRAWRGSRRAVGRPTRVGSRLTRASYRNDPRLSSATCMPGTAPCLRPRRPYAWHILDPLIGGPRGARWLRGLVFGASAAFAAATLRFAWREPLISAGLLGGLFTFSISRWVARRRLRKVLLSGDVRSVLERWSPSL